jgi:hypothetical protein
MVGDRSDEKRPSLNRHTYTQGRYQLKVGAGRGKSEKRKEKSEAYRELEQDGCLAHAAGPDQDNLYLLATARTKKGESAMWVGLGGGGEEVSTRLVSSDRSFTIFMPELDERLGMPLLLHPPIPFC